MEGGGESAKHQEVCDFGISTHFELGWVSVGCGSLCPGDEATVAFEGHNGKVACNWYYSLDAWRVIFSYYLFVIVATQFLSEALQFALIINRQLIFLQEGY